MSFCLWLHLYFLAACGICRVLQRLFLCMGPCRWLLPVFPGFAVRRRRVYQRLLVDMGFGLRLLYFDSAFGFPLLLLALARVAFDIQYASTKVDRCIRCLLLASLH